ncbi:hypothetical protein FPV67DRAFT_1431157, partial [Lyophyllum atratum]
SKFSSSFLQFSIQWSSIALLYFDYALTFGMEVEYMWRQKFRFSTILYICCRYGLVANIVYLLTIANKITLSVTRCNAGYRISGALSVLGRTAVVIVWGARTYAVFARSRLVLTFFGTIGLMIVILDVVSCSTLREDTLCSKYPQIHVPTTIFGGLLAIMMCIFEICSAGLTTLRSIQALNVGGPWRSQKKGFMYLLFEQGTLYFCVVTVFTITSLALNVVSGGFLQRLLNAYTVPLSGLMTARFLLHLRKWESKHVGFQSAGPRQAAEREETTTMDFTTSAKDSVGRSTISSYIDEFGEDPLQRARNGGGIVFLMDDMPKEGSENSRRSAQASLP